MGYEVRKVPYGRRAWKLQLQTYVGSTRKTRDIPEEEWAALGFHRGMSLEDAKARRDQLNALGHVKQVEAKRRTIKDRLKAEAKVLTAYLHPRDILEFERTVLYEGVDPDTSRRNKTESHWRTAQRVLFDLKVEPEEWGERRKSFYAYFVKRKFSPAYLQKVIRVLNLWGKFVTRKRKQFFDELPYPVGYEKEKVADAYFDKRPAGMASNPTTPKMLESAKSEMQPEHYTWVYLSVWFGLRPVEIDGLKDPKLWKVEHKEDTPVLWVYQSKLKNIPRDKRWKYIPCLQPEQVAGIEAIKEGKFDRPLVKTLRNHFGDGIGLYGGRKGFENLMESYGYTLEQYSVWLGHQSIERTWRNYKQKQAIVIPK